MNLCQDSSFNLITDKVSQNRNLKRIKQNFLRHNVSSNLIVSFSNLDNHPELAGKLQNTGFHPEHNNGTYVYCLALVSMK